MTSPPEIRRELRPGDLGAVVAHHMEVYPREYGVDSGFADHVAATVERAVKRGFPRAREAIWIVEHRGKHAGSIALTDEGDDAAALRWVLLDRELRGRGLGRQLVGEALAKAEQLAYRRVWLDTFSELETAAHLYRAHGFKVLSEDAAPRWGRDRIVYQHYEVELRKAERETRASGGAATGERAGGTPRSPARNAPRARAPQPAGTTPRS